MSARAFIVDAPGTINEIPFGVACKNPRFVFDRPFTLTKENHLELIEGRWFLVDNEFHIRIPLAGKWDR